jgi:hypothetical protein
VTKTDPGPVLRALGWAIAGASTLLILVLTLTAVGDEHQIVTRLNLCVICGHYGTANLLRNVLLFVPLGVGLGLARPAFLRAWLPAVVLTTFIELAQIFIPGRNPLPIDWAANSAGGALGILLVRTLSVRLRRGGPGGAGWGWIALSFATLAATTTAFQLAPPAPPHHIQITPNLGHLESYGGQVDSANLGEEVLRVGRHGDPARLEALLLGTAPGGSSGAEPEAPGVALRIQARAGPPPPGVAPLVSVYTGAQEELFLLGADGTDLVLRLPYRAGRLALMRPDLRLRDALDGLDEGSPMTITSRLAGRAGACLSLEGPLGGREACGLRPTVGEGWALLLFPGRVARDPTGRLRPLLDGVWLLGLGALAGAFVSSVGAAVVLGGALVALGWLGPSMVGSLAYLPLWQAMVLAGGVGLGWGGMTAARRWARSPNP